jgi:protein ImuB
MRAAVELYACVHVREFPAQAMLRLRPELRGRAVAILEGEPPLQTVCSCNAKARALGVGYGLTRVELDSFPAMAALLRSRAEEAAARAVLLECAGSFSPRVEDCGQDGAGFVCVLDIAGTGRLFGPPQTVAQSLLRRVKALGLTASVAVSSNFHAAICAARGSRAGGVRVIEAGEEATALAGLPLTVLDVTEQQAESFALWGIESLGMLAALPERALIARLGQEGGRLRKLARGECPHLFRPVEPAFLLEERMELDSPVEALDSLLFVVGVMLEQLILRATARVLALASVQVTLALEGGGEHRRSVRPALPSNDRQMWLKLLHLDLEEHPPPAAILALTLRAEPGTSSKVQMGLFAPQTPEPMRLDVTLARIRAIVGEQGVGRAVLRDSHEPEGFRVEAFRVEPGSSAKVKAASQTQATTDTSIAALRQLRPPEDVSMTLRDRRPVRFRFRGKEFAVEHAFGPWRSSGDWWSPERWSLDQWDVVARSEEGGRLCCCLMRDRIHRGRGVWQMAALYD